MKPARPNRQELHDNVVALPHVEGESDMLDEASALAVYEELRSSNPALYNHIGQLISMVTDELTEKVNLPPHILRGAVARSAIAASTQTVYELGEANRSIELIRYLVGDNQELEQSFKTFQFDEEPPAA